MVRWVYMLIVFAGLAAWASAQNPVAPQPPLSAEDKLRLLKTNSILIGNLVNEGVAMSNPDQSVALRVEHCRKASRSLVNAILQAADAQDAERVAELTGLFREFVLNGFVPMLQEAKRDVNPESPDGQKVRTVQKAAADDLDALKAATSSGKVSESQSVQDAVKHLGDLADQLK